VIEVADSLLLLARSTSLESECGRPDLSAEQERQRRAAVPPSEIGDVVISYSARSRVASAPVRSSATVPA
jgi:hypothetical protein